MGRFAGHWGIDIGVPLDTPVHAADDGVVTFAGNVAGMLSVTVSHGGGLRTSYSYLASLNVATGQRVSRVTALGRSGNDHGVAALHFSVRVEDRYRDPLDWLGCFREPSSGLRLVPVADA